MKLINDSLYYLDGDENLKQIQPGFYLIADDRIRGDFSQIIKSIYTLNNNAIDDSGIQQVMIKIASAKYITANLVFDCIFDVIKLHTCGIFSHVFMGICSSELLNRYRNIIIDNTLVNKDRKYMSHIFIMGFNRIVSYIETITPKLVETDKYRLH